MTVHLDAFDDMKKKYFKRRTESRGPFVPMMAWLEDGPRDEYGDLEDDQEYKLIWWPHLQDRTQRFFLDFWKYVEIEQLLLDEIEKDEFEWLMTLKDL